MSTAAQICLYIMLSLVINVVAYTIICQWREAVEENRKLRYIRCLATNISATNCTANMTNATNVAANGVFVKAASNNSWTSGANGIPNGWTIVNEEV